MSTLIKFLDNGLKIQAATPGITFRMFEALASKKINILVISTSEIKISVLVASKNVKKAVAVLHKEFKLD